MIYFGFDSDFGKISVSVPGPVLIPDPDNIKDSFKHKKICKKSCFFNVRSSIVSQKFGLTFLIFWLLCSVFHFILDPDPNPVPESEPKCIPVPVPLCKKLRFWFYITTGYGSK